MAKNNPVSPASVNFTNSSGEAHVDIQCLRRALFHRWLWFDDIRFFKPHAMLFDLGIHVYIIHNKMPNRYVEFVRNYATENYISLNCAICQIKENNLYKPLDKKQKEEEKKKDELLSEKILLRSINAF